MLRADAAGSQHVGGKRSTPGAILYERVVGEDWGHLPEAVHRAHLLDGDLMQAGAVFRVRHGQNGFARLMAWLARLPAQSDAAPVRLSVRRVDGGERWERVFPNTRLVSTQYDAGDGLLGENFGLMDVRFRLMVVERALVYAQQGAALRLGNLRLPVPKFLSMQITARESAAADGVTSSHPGEGVAARGGPAGRI